MWAVLFACAMVLIAVGAVLAAVSAVYELLRWLSTPGKVKATSRRGARLTDLELDRFFAVVCPDCGWRLDEGPSAGLCTNLRCSNPKCRSEFNMVIAPDVIERLTPPSPASVIRIAGPPGGPYRSGSN